MKSRTKKKALELATWGLCIVYIVWSFAYVNNVEIQQTSIKSATQNVNAFTCEIVWLLHYYQHRCVLYLCIHVFLRLLQRLDGSLCLMCEPQPIHKEPIGWMYCNKVIFVNKILKKNMANANGNIHFVQWLSNVTNPFMALLCAWSEYIHSTRAYGIICPHNTKKEI